MSRMKTKAICPKCGADIQLWRGQIAVCTATIMFHLVKGPMVEKACSWQGQYPERVEVEDK